jgi:biopolymer transport protein ExbB/TolQ
MSLLSQALYWITTGLLVPSVCLLLLLGARALILSGSDIAAALDRRRYGAEIDRAFTTPDFPRDNLASLRLPKSAPLAETFQALLALSHTPAQRQRILAQLEILHEKRIAETRVLSRVGPMLGLMGTLIPLGPALLGLAEGDLDTLAQSMLVAFATTVVGLLIGGIGFALQQPRQR